MHHSLLVKYKFFFIYRLAKLITCSTITKRKKLVMVAITQIYTVLAIIILYKTEGDKQALLRQHIYSGFGQIYHLKLSIVLVAGETNKTSVNTHS